VVNAVLLFNATRPALLAELWPRVLLSAAFVTSNLVALATLWAAAPDRCVDAAAVSESASLALFVATIGFLLLRAWLRFFRELCSPVPIVAAVAPAPGAALGSGLTKAQIDGALTPVKPRRAPQQQSPASAASSTDSDSDGGSRSASPAPSQSSSSPSTAASSPSSVASSPESKSAAASAIDIAAADAEDDACEAEAPQCSICLGSLLAESAESAGGAGAAGAAACADKDCVAAPCLHEFHRGEPSLVGFVCVFVRARCALHRRTLHCRCRSASRSLSLSHSGCMERWLLSERGKNSCPLCRAPVVQLPDAAAAAADSGDSDSAIVSAAAAAVVVTVVPAGEAAAFRVAADSVDAAPVPLQLQQLQQQEQQFVAIEMEVDAAPATSP
jgi:hypothetical protein